MTNKVIFCKRELNQNEQKQIELQNTRLVSKFQAEQLEKNAKKYWDLFYKRNETKFFKDRHWTTREFHELLGQKSNSKTNLLEIGCGVGNLIYPLLEENEHLFIYACDLSPRAIEFVKQNPKYDSYRICAFECDITKEEEIFSRIEKNSIDIVTLVFVLSAIHPKQFDFVLNNIFSLLRPNGILLFRDYAQYDMAQLRFKPGHKISENFYMRQDGTRCYYFCLEELERLLTKNNFELVSNEYIERRTVNKKEGVDVPRLFVQCKARKKIDSCMFNCS